MSFGFDPTPLTRSIQRVGLVNNPLLLDRGTGSFSIITGYRRIQALQSLGWENIPARIFDEKQVSLTECLLVNLFDNLATRELNPVEKGMALSRLQAHFNRREITRDFMPLMNLAAHAATLMFLVAVANHLEDEIRLDVAQGRIARQAAGMLLELTPQERIAIHDVLRELKLNTNQQKQFIEYIIEIANRDRIAIPQLLLEPDLKSIRQDPGRNKPQKAKAILHFLRGKRSPALTQAEKMFHQKVTELKLPEGVNISAPPFFEAPDYRLELHFKDGKALKCKLDELTAIAGLEDFRDPWEEEL
jgi:ParB-like chromosome segregation protein Spo0J